MNAYLFTSISTITQVRPTARTLHQTINTLQTWDASRSLVVLEENPAKAQQLFEECSRMQPQDQNPMQIDVRRIAGAQFVDQLLTEERNETLDWHKVSKQELSQVESTPVDYFEQGYWVDVDQAVRPGKLSANIDALRGDLPQDISAGLNWAADKQFLFMLSVFSPPPAPGMLEMENDLSESPDEAAEKSDTRNLRELYNTYPEARDKEAAALIQARNSVVAAWIWRRYALSTPLAGNEIRIEPLCDIIGLPDDSET
jgi:hypothetical protein